MSFELARSDVVTAALAAKAAWAGPPTPLALEFQNVTVIDLERQTVPYVCVEIHFLDGEQLSFGQTKVVADYGQIHIIAHTPGNAGTLTGQKILDHFRTFFELKNFSVIRTKTAQGAASYESKGWDCWPLVIPFWFHRLVT